MNCVLTIAAVALVLAKSVSCLDNGLARTPPMGWLSWERFRCNVDCENYPDSCISENLYMAMADRLVADGYRDLGYVYVNIDDCWSEKARDNATKQLIPDRKRFSHGIKWLSDYMHQRGLKLGIYADYGLFTCGGYPGSMGYFDVDAKTFASWDVDSVKFDGCFSDATTDKKAYPAFGRALNATGHPMLYSCEWPLYEYANNISSDYKAIAETCNLFRNYNDVDDSFDSIKSIINYYAKNNGHFLEAAGPGAFLDPDMIVAGDFGLSIDQQRTQLGMWTIFAAPLYMSNDLRQVPAQSKALLQNKGLIAINQDTLGKAGQLAYHGGDIQIWTRPLSNSKWVIGAINFGESTPTSVPKSLNDLKVPVPSTSTFELVEVFNQYSFNGTVSPKDPIPFVVNPSGITLVLLTPSTLNV